MQCPRCKAYNFYCTHDVHSKAVDGYTIHAVYRRTGDSHAYYDYWLTDADNNTLIETYGGLPKHTRDIAIALIHGLFCATSKSADDDTPNTWLDSVACEALSYTQSTLEDEQCVNCGRYLYQCANWDYDVLDNEQYICEDCKQ